MPTGRHALPPTELLAPLPVRPARRWSAAPRMPAGFVAGGATAGIKAIGQAGPRASSPTTGGPGRGGGGLHAEPRSPRRPVRLSRANLAATAPGRAAAAAAGPRRSSRPAAAPTPRPAPAGDADQAAIARRARGGARHRAARGVLDLSTGRHRDAAPGRQGHRRDRERSSPAGLARDRRGASRRPRTRCGRPTRAPKVAARHGRAPRRRTAAPVPVTVAGIAKGVGMIHPRMATMLAVVLTDAAVEPGDAPRAPPARRRRGPGTSSRWTATRARTTRSSSSPPARPGAAPVVPGSAGRGGARAGDRGRRPRPRPPAGGRRRGRDDAASPAGCPARRDDADARAVARAVVSSSLVRPPSTAATRTGAGSPARPATPVSPRRAILEAAGLAPARGRAPAPAPARRRGPGPAADRDRRPPRLRRAGRRPGRLRQGRGPRGDGRPRGPRPPRPRPRARAPARPSAAT